MLGPVSQWPKGWRQPAQNSTSPLGFGHPGPHPRLSLHLYIRGRPQSPLNASGMTTSPQRDPDVVASIPTPVFSG